MTVLYRTVQAMTMPFTLSLKVTDEEAGQVLIDQMSHSVHQDLMRLEQKFSAFKPDSLLTRYQRGQGDALLDREFQEVYLTALAAQEDTLGGFNPYFDGDFNPTGLVKGWAIEKIFKASLQPLLQKPWVEAVCLNGAGDLQLAVSPLSDFSWSVGIEKAQNPSELIAKLSLREGAVASSGLSKKGRHIQGASSATSQVTIIDRQLTTADIWATALMALAEDQVQELIASRRLSGLYQTAEKTIYFQHGVIQHA